MIQLCGSFHVVFGEERKLFEESIESILFYLELMVKHTSKLSLFREFHSQLSIVLFT